MDEEMIKVKKKCQREKLRKEKNSNCISYIRLLIFFLFIITMSCYLSNHESTFLILLGILFCSFIVIATIHSKINKEIDKMKCYISLIKRYEDRCTNNWKNENIENIQSNDNFVNDLDIINGNSLLKYIDFTQSLGGRKNLIDSLSLKNIIISNEEIKIKQSAIIELRKKNKFVLDFQYILSKINNIKGIDYKDYFYFFEKKKVNQKIELSISLIFSLLTIISFIFSVFKIIQPYYFVGLLFFQIISSYIYMTIYNSEFDDISKCSRCFSDLKKIYNFIGNQKFETQLNYELKNKIYQGKVILKEINKISDINSYRFNFITYILFNVFGSLNFVILYKYNNLLCKKNEYFKESIIALEQFEKMISMATIGIVKENICLPIIEDDYALSVELIQHPLLNEKDCISNNFICDKDINIITGSNMSGKTSFMKTIGMNLILAYNGTYVNATSFNCPIANVFTSINVKDDISKGISTFYGELKRIKDILDFSQKCNNKMIVFIDEIFKGTNYNDRILGAKETLKQLSELNCIVFLTTHDFELCEIKNKEIKNYHFSEKYNSDKISFDYKIKAGQCKTTNAKYLMKQIGIIK